MKKSLKTIKIKRALAGEPESYSEDQIKEIMGVVGPLPAGKVVYQGDFAVFSILGEDIPELTGMYHHYMYDGPLKKRQMTRELALHCHLEGAAWKYKKDKKLKARTPSQNMKYLSRVEKACNTLIEGMGSFECLSSRFQDRINSSVPRLRKEADRLLVPLKEEILKQKEICSRQKIPRDKRRQKDIALYDFIYSLCEAWDYILEKKISPGSVSADGESGGPLIRFIRVAIAPLGVDKTPHAVRKILKELGSNQKI